jgi:GTP cyclohydrolase I
MARRVEWKEITALSERVAAAHASKHVEGGVYGIPRGGCVPAALIASFMKLPLLDAPVSGCLVVDDIADSSATISRVTASVGQGVLAAALFGRPSIPVTEHLFIASATDDWLIFPWEANEAPGEDAITRLLQAIGEDPSRDGLRDTPARVIRAWKELTSGYSADVTGILARTFVSSFDEMVIVRDIPFVSTCEHHLMPFHGKATVGYLPRGGVVVGLSKIARVVDAFARRLQIQERMTEQIAASLTDALQPLGVGVIVTAEHECMACRGVNKTGISVTTSAMLGVFRSNPEARSEFIALTGGR